MKDKAACLQVDMRYSRDWGEASPDRGAKDRHSEPDRRPLRSLDGFPYAPTIQGVRDSATGPSREGVGSRLRRKLPQTGRTRSCWPVREA